MNSMLNNWPIDPAVVIIALGVITLLLLIMTVICIMQTSRLYRRYDYFMRGKDAESMEEIILNLSEQRCDADIVEKCQRILSEIWHGEI